MLNCLIAILIVFEVFAFPTNTFAEEITLTPIVWDRHTEVTVTGNDLQGQYYGLRKLCLAKEAKSDDIVCFGHFDAANKAWVPEDPLITKWEKNQLVFSVPNGAPPRGIVVLFRFFDHQDCYGSAGCVATPEQQRSDIGIYSAHPQIDSITNMPTTAFNAGQDYEIHGALFGNEQVYILVGKKMIAASGHTYLLWDKMPSSYIAGWTNDTIRIRPAYSVDVSFGIKVSNGAFESDPFVPSTSTSTSSSISISTSSGSKVSTAPFPDVRANAEYADAVSWAKGKGIIGGYEDGTFRPDKPVNRAEYLKIVFGATELPMSLEGALGFDDVNEQAWYAPFVRSAKKAGIIKGYLDGTFRPEQTVSFAEGLKMGYLTFSIPIPETNGAWYEGYLRDAIAHGVLREMNIDVASGMTRKDVVWMVWKLANLKR